MACRHQRWAMLLLIVLAIMCHSATRCLAENSSGTLTRLDLRKDCGAVGDAVTDDSMALKRCLNIEMTPRRARPPVLDVPPGVYLIGPAAGPMPLLTQGFTIQGSGTSESIFKLDDTFVGHLFAWSEAWVAGFYDNNSVNAVNDTSGPAVTGVKIVGSLKTKNSQSAIVFYDRNDFVTLRDLEISYINGPCLSIGKVLRRPQGYLRESTFFNIRCWKSGSDNQPAIDIGSTSQVGSDATNELDFYKLAVFDARRVGVSIGNANPFNATRKIRFFGLRVEKTGGDAVVIAPQDTHGQVAEVDFYDLSTSNSGSAGLRIGNESGNQPYAIGVHGGLFGPGNTVGLAIDSGRMIEIDLSGIDGPVVLGSGLGPDIRISGNGSERAWKYVAKEDSSLPPSDLNLHSNLGVYGLPSSSDRTGVVVLQGTTETNAAMNLTMDGAAQSTLNCFRAGYSQIFKTDISVLAVDVKNPDHNLSWYMPNGIFMAWTGSASARFLPSQYVSHGDDEAKIELTANRNNGCLNVVFVPPYTKNSSWKATASIYFLKSP